MKLKRILRWAALLLAIFRALITRVLRCRPLRPTWTLKFELLVAFLRHAMKPPAKEPIFKSHADLVAHSQKLRHHMKKGMLRKNPKDGAVRPVSIGSLQCQWITRAEFAESERVILYLHGGGFNVMDVDCYRPVLFDYVKRLRARVFAIDYRLSPEHVFPAAIEDAKAAFRYLIETEGIDPRNIVIMGDSAGGNLCITTTLSLIEDGSDLPGAVVAISPWADLTSSMPSHTKNARFDFLPVSENPRHDPNKSIEAAKEGRVLRDLREFYAGNTSLRHPLVSPMFADFTGFPPLLVQAGEAELLADEGLALGKRAMETSTNPVEVKMFKDQIHCFQTIFLFRNHPQTKEALKDMDGFLTDHLGRAPPTLSG